jgi:transposase
MLAKDQGIDSASLDHLSQRTMAGKEERARAGYHSGPVPFGYLPPDYPKAPAGAPSTWHPPPLPVRADPVTFPALVRMGELVAQGWTDTAIAEELMKSHSHPSRFDAPRFTKDSIAALRRSWFPREFAPGCGHGTIQTPSGELVEGKHQAAWPYELWQRMVEVKASQYRRPRKEALQQPHEFSRIIVCAACRRPLRVTTTDNIPYYSDTSRTCHFECPASGSLTVRSERVIQQFGDVLRSIVLPTSWRQAIAERCQEETQEEEDHERVLRRRAELEEEQQRVVTVFIKGVITEEELDAKMEDIRAELATLPLPGTRSGDDIAQAALPAGETLGNLADYWSEATAQERRDLVWSLLPIGGLVYDLERQGIIGLLPRESVLPVLSLGLEATGYWEQRDGGLWLRQEYWSEKRTRSTPHVLPPQAASLTPAQQEEAIALLQQGWSLRDVAHQLGASRGSIHRLARKAGVMLPENGPKLTATQQAEALEMVRSGASLRQVAQRFGIHHESVRRLVRKKQQEQEV